MSQDFDPCVEEISKLLYCITIISSYLSREHCIVWIFTFVLFGCLLCWLVISRIKFNLFRFPQARCLQAGNDLGVHCPKLESVSERLHHEIFQAMVLSVTEWSGFSKHLKIGKILCPMLKKVIFLMHKAKLTMYMYAMFFMFAILLTVMSLNVAYKTHPACQCNKILLVRNLDTLETRSKKWS